MAYLQNGTTVIDNSNNLTVNSLTVTSGLNLTGRQLYKNSTSTYTSSTNTHTIDCSTGNYFSIDLDGQLGTVVNHSFIEHTATSSTSYNLPSGIQAGDVIYIYTFVKGFSVPSVSGFTNGGTSALGTVAVGQAVAFAAEPLPTTFTISARTGSGNLIAVVVFRNMNATTAENVLSGSNSMPDPGSTIVAANGISLIIGFLGDQSLPVGITAPSGYTLLGSYAATGFTGTIMAAHRFLTSSGTVDPGVFGGSNTGVWLAVHVAVPPTSSANPTLTFTNVPAGQAYTCLVRINNNTANGLIYPTGTLYAENSRFIPAKATSGDQVFTTTTGLNWYVSNITGI